VPPRYANKETELVARGVHVKKFSAIAERAERRLDQLVAATSLADLGLPGLRLEALKGDRQGQYSVRINRQYRICFEWVDGEAVNVEIVDYHN
jgi:proteic killer suppression protein